MDLIRGAGRPHTWNRRQTLIREGDHPDGVVLIGAGLTKITKHCENGYTSTLAVRGAGELVGEQACLDGGRRSATVTALEQVSGVVVPLDRFRRLLSADEALCLAVLCGMSVRLRDSEVLRADHGAWPGPVRVGQVLLGLAVRYGTDARERPGARSVPLNQNELAGAAATSRETVQRTMRRLQREGLADGARGRVVVLDPARLRRWVDAQTSR
ncbi:Crp/Fnr family transcriptional regulator [Streptomyces sp. B1866]|uniref:Crp/Fnr family transcriptional regulator n=1 Tax=Streptomyces sp. B1866 TaxID=3075431 RepID=UPI002891C584|nr:Crp/Fnr family transcriptional regulator [Streptomyces sp. B1866]MDT3398121.1 Crp/Fnr family transcriptional regulator [Streptomyces sp. B1866]